MFFFKKKHKPVDLSWLSTDMHSHLIAGIDDGSPDVETSLFLIKSLTELGYRKLVTTPHIFWELYPNTPEVISKGLQELKPAVASSGIEVEMKAAAEYFIDEHFQEQLKNKAPLLCISGNMVLVEFSMVTAPLDLMEVFFEMQLQGYQPVIAHPERYAYLERKKGFFDDMKNAGCFFQLNLLSITGHYGEVVQQLAEYLLKKNYYELAGTDLHHTKHITMLQKLSAAPLYSRLQDVDWKNKLL